MKHHRNADRIRHGAILTAGLIIGLLALLPVVRSTVSGSSASTSAPTLVIRGGSVFDATTEQSRPLGQLWIAGETILAEHPAGTSIPDGTAVIDASGMTVLPGLFDLHVHLMSTASFYTAPVRIDSSRNMAAFLASGVTSVLDLFSMPDWVFAEREKSKDPDYLGPRIYAAGPILTAPGGHGTQMGVPTSTMSNREEAIAAVRALAPKRPDVVKIAFDDLAFSGNRLAKLKPEAAAGVVEEAHRRGLRVFAHVTNVDDAVAMVGVGVDAFAHFPAFPGKTPDSELVAMMRERGVGVVPSINLFENITLIPSKGPVYDAENFDKKVAWEVLEVLEDEATRNRQSMMRWRGATAENRRGWRARLAAMRAGGIVVGAGTDSGNPQAFAGVGIVDELDWYVQAGFTPAQAIRSATADAAKLLGVDAEVGTLTAGKRADVLLVEGDPTRDIRDLYKTRRVIRLGRDLDLAELHRAVNPESSKPRTVVLESSTLDRFDRADLVAATGQTWQPQNDVFMGGESKVALAVTENRTLRLDLELTGNPRFGAYMAGAALNLTERPADRVDLSSYEGVRLRARWLSGAARPILLRLPTAAVRDFDFHQKFLALTGEWKTYEVPFSSLAQIGFGAPVKFRADEVQQLVLILYGAPSGKFSFEVDDIELY